jgi:hypothetical protein
MKINSIMKNAFNKAKGFMDSLKKEPKNAPKKFAKEFSRKYKTPRDKTNRNKQSKSRQSNFEAGSLVTFKYDALHKDKKYDKNPLVVSLGFSKEHGKKYFYGLNIHWLPKHRRVLVAQLIAEMLKDNKNVLTYNDVKPLLKIFEKSPILRMYYIPKVSKKILKMPKEVYMRAASIDYSDWHNP